jgi:XTP/dITP diphosphohydrolase
MLPIVLATQNPHKIDELGAIFAKVGLGVVGLADVLDQLPPEPDEVGTTFHQNAAIKARAYAMATGRLCLADDSGIEVDALDGEPGVISSHYCTNGKEVGMSRTERDEANNKKLLEALEGVSPADRTARFVCSMVLCEPASETDAEIIATARGTFQGRIGLPGEVPRGANGFGYDPLFLVGPEFTLTSAQIAPERKNQLSHRGVASRQMARCITNLFASDSSL